MTLEIRLSKKIYPNSALASATKDYSKIANFKIINEEEYYRIKMFNHSDHPQGASVLKEFANYALGLTKKCL